MTIEIHIDLSKPKYCEHLVPMTQSAYERHKGERCRKCGREYEPILPLWQEWLGVVIQSR
jgi:hypothetical protein